MSKRTIALIVILIGITAGLLGIALYTTQQNSSLTKTDEQPVVTTTPTPPAHTILSLNPSTLVLPTSGTGKVEVLIDTQDNTAATVQLEIGYDPEVLTNVVVAPGTFFASPTVPLNIVNKKTGRISYGMAVGNASKAASGTGVVATITFSKVPGTTASTTQLELLPKSLVTQIGVMQSILKETSGTTITIQTNGQPSQSTQSATSN